MSYVLCYGLTVVLASEFVGGPLVCNEEVRRRTEQPPPLQGSSVPDAPGSLATSYEPIRQRIIIEPFDDDDEIIESLKRGSMALGRSLC